jgi:hypothetical protein
MLQQRRYKNRKERMVESTVALREKAGMCANLPSVEEANCGFSSAKGQSNKAPDNQSQSGSMLSKPDSENNGRLS